MKSVLYLMLLTLVVGCGEGTPSEVTPEKQAEMDAKMQQEMQSMMGQMQNSTPPMPGGKK